MQRTHLLQPVVDQMVLSHAIRTFAIEITAGERTDSFALERGEMDVRHWHFVDAVQTAKRIVVITHRVAGTPSRVPLTGREAAVAHGLAEGKSHKQMSAEMEISIPAISTYLKRAQMKMGVSSNLALVGTLALQNRMAVLLARPSTRWRRLTYAGGEFWCISSERTGNPILTLSDENIILDLFRGHSATVIANMTARSRHAVEAQIGHVVRKTKSKSRLALATYWINDITA